MQPPRTSKNTFFQQLCNSKLNLSWLYCLLAPWGRPELCSTLADIEYFLFIRGFPVHQSKEGEGEKSQTVKRILYEREGSAVQQDSTAHESQRKRTHLVWKEEKMFWRESKGQEVS